MKVCFTLDSMNSGGAERVASILANNFAKKGHDVYIIMVSSLKMETFYELNNVKLICLMKGFSKKVGVFKRIRLLKQELIDISPDIVISFLPHVTIYTYLALRKTNIKIICSERNDPSRLRFIFKIALKYIYKKVDGNVFQTDIAQQWYGKHISKKCIVIANPLDTSVYYREIGDRKKEILSVGRLVEQKNFGLLINVFASFIKEKNNEEYTLKIYGDGPLLKDLESLSARKGISNKVIFMGNSNTWLEDEYDSGMFVLASNFEGMPNALLEALALGIPCISTDCPVGGPAKLIVNGVNGLLIPVGDEKELFRSMMSLTDSDFCNRISRSNVNLASKYSTDAISDEWLSFIDLVLNG